MNTKFNSFDYTSVQQIPEVMLRVELLKKRLECLKNKKIQNVLEVGVGSGDTTLMLAKEFKSVLCIDIDQATLNNAQLRIKKNGVSNVHFACGNIAEDLLLDQKYDHVFLIGILEHLDDPVKSLKLMSKYLTSQGIIYILVNLANSLHRWLGVAMGDIKEVSELSDSDIKLGHYRVYDLKLLQCHIADAQLKIVFQELFYVKPFPTFIMNELPMNIHYGLNKLAERFPEFASYVYLEVNKLE